MQTAHDSRELTQTAADGRTRTFRFSATSDGTVMFVDIRDATGSPVPGASLSYHFTDGEFDRFRDLAGRA